MQFNLRNTLEKIQGWCSIINFHNKITSSEKGLPNLTAAAAALLLHCKKKVKNRFLIFNCLLDFHKKGQQV